MCNVNSYTYTLTPKSRIHLLASCALLKIFFGQDWGQWKGVCVGEVGGGVAGACSVIVVGRLLRILAVDCKWALCLPCSAQILASKRAGTGGGAAGQLVVLLLVWQKFFDDVAKVVPLLSSNLLLQPQPPIPLQPERN